MKSQFVWDENYGFMHYEPYASGAYEMTSNFTKKPGFKVWVDGGIIDYPLKICYSKSLDCSATCCK